MHHIFNMTLEGKLYLAPIGDNPQRVLVSHVILSYWVELLGGCQEEVASKTLSSLPILYVCSKADSECLQDIGTGTGK
jgi:hypothetical protein